MRGLIEVLAAEIRHQAVLFGYWIRPYDMLADARRWRWQKRHPCQFGDGVPAVVHRWQHDHQ